MARDIFVLFLMMISSLRISKIWVYAFQCLEYFIFFGRVVTTRLPPMLVLFPFQLSLPSPPLLLHLCVYLFFIFLSNIVIFQILNRYFTSLRYKFSCQPTTVTISTLTFLDNNCFFPTCLRSVIPAILEFHICISNFNNPLATCAISSTYQCSQRLGNFFSLAKVCNARAPISLLVGRCGQIRDEADSIHSFIVPFSQLFF